MTRTARERIIHAAHQASANRKYVNLLQAEERAYEAAAVEALRIAREMVEELEPYEESGVSFQNGWYVGASHALKAIDDLTVLVGGSHVVEKTEDHGGTRLTADAAVEEQAPPLRDVSEKPPRASTLNPYDLSDVARARRRT